MRFIRSALLACLMLSIFPANAYGPYSSRSLLEKTIYFLDEEGKVGSCKFWSLNLGKHSFTLTKYFAGEGDVPVEAEMNFSLLSSMYIEGTGYSSRGKITAEAEFGVLSDGVSRKVDADSLYFVFARGAKGAVLGGDVQDIVIKVQDTDLTIRRMVVRKYLLDKVYDELKHEKDITVTAFSFSKAGIQRAVAETKKLPKPTAD